MKTLSKTTVLFTVSITFIVASLMFVVRDSSDSMTHLMNNENQSTVIASNATIKSKCSAKADDRGPHQKVMALSLSVTSSSPIAIASYIKSLKERLSEFSSLYPGWVMRIYHDLSPDDGTLNWFILNDYLGTLSNVSSYLDLCYFNSLINTTKGRYYNHFAWRLLPLLDDYVDTFVSRDIDNLITRREVAAVREWLESNRTFHIMRDHPAQCDSISSGLWGAKLTSSQRPRLKKLAARKLFKIRHRHHDGFDKSILKQFIWPLARLDAMVHDSYCCDNFFDYRLGSNSISRPFPVKRFRDEFVGKSTSSNSFPRFECPMKCRPSHHPDWTFC